MLRIKTPYPGMLLRTSIGMFEADAQGIMLVPEKIAKALSRRFKAMEGDQAHSLDEGAGDIKRPAAPVVSTVSPSNPVGASGDSSVGQAETSDSNVAAQNTSADGSAPPAEKE